MLLSDIGVNNLKSLAEYYCSELSGVFKDNQEIKNELETLSKTVQIEDNLNKLEDLIIAISTTLEKIESLVNQIQIENNQDMKDFLKAIVFSRLAKNNLESAVECISIIKYLGNNSEVENLDQSTVNNSFAIQLLKSKVSNVIRVFDSLCKKNDNFINFDFFEKNLTEIYKAESLSEIVSLTKKLLQANDEFLQKANKLIEENRFKKDLDFEDLTFFTINAAKAIAESSAFIMTTSIVQDILKRIN
ncbi:hypothetical protein SSABA_v1c06920 [Spiroplasma sabaudiense Ar-1343]|uniref:Uncharacterized protein n=1 Tax=Spiroplasma sabaudiense Ar-1343 TaxID=1276257 RepID=W6AK40_9MOLU|nr:hypothetical protein [Spiroplasma sabaudiense]AHI54094.1 hypothetical protein SSABA_v1c06920 [Spiroplasma sabaudiense Ar-1343]